LDARTTPGQDTFPGRWRPAQEAVGAFQAFWAEVLAVPADGSKPARSSWQSKSRATFSTESRNPHFPKFNDKIVLGLVGSIVGGAIYRALGIPPDAGMVSTVIVAILAAAGVIAGQRTMWPTVARD
jgi:hypothetical protein